MTDPSRWTVPLKGQCHEIFCFWFFHESVSTQPQSIPFRPFRICSKIRGDICESRCTTGINNTGGKFAAKSMTPVANLPLVSATPVANFSTISASVVDTGGQFPTSVNDTVGKFAAGVNYVGGKLPPVLTTPVANLPPVSSTTTIMATISGCRHLKVNLKAKIYIYVNSTTQRCPNKIISIFLLEGFFHFQVCHRVNDTGGKPGAANISANFRKNSQRP
jgi:hypothetical protein